MPESIEELAPTLELLGAEGAVGTAGVSAVVPKLDHEATSELLGEPTTRATSRLTYVECHAAFARGRRAARLSAADVSRVARAFDRRWADLVVIEPDAPVAERAVGLVHEHPLRSADAIHLAAAHELVDRPAEPTFACWDRRLWEAARAEGFRVVPSEAP